MTARACARAREAIEETFVPDTQEINWRKLREKAGPFPPNTYVFIQEGLRHTVETLAKKDPNFPPSGRHVSGQELCLGLRDWAIKCFGPLARTVLESWGIRRTEDFGKIVFALVDVGLLRKTDEDNQEDFRGVFDFDDAFGQRPASTRRSKETAHD